MYKRNLYYGAGVSNFRLSRLPFLTLRFVVVYIKIMDKNDPSPVPGNTIHHGSSACPAEIVLNT
jgi:hypothetical protein